MITGLALAVFDSFIFGGACLTWGWQAAGSSPRSFVSTVAALSSWLALVTKGFVMFFIWVKTTLSSARSRWHQFPAFASPLSWTLCVVSPLILNFETLSPDKLSPEPVSMYVTLHMFKELSYESWILMTLNLTQTQTWYSNSNRPDWGNSFRSGSAVWCTSLMSSRRRTLARHCRRQLGSPGVGEFPSIESFFHK